MLNKLRQVELWKTYKLVGTVGQLSDFEKPQAVCSPVKRK